SAGTTDGRRSPAQPARRRPRAGRCRRSRRAAIGLSGYVGEAFRHLSAYLERQKRGRGRAAGRLSDGLAQGRDLRSRPGKPDHLAGGHCPQPGDRPAAIERDEPAHGSDRGRRGGGRSFAGCGRARRAQATAATPRRLPRGARGASGGRHPGGVPRRRDLRRAGRAHERADRHDEELDSPRTVETESLSRAMSEDDTIDPAGGAGLRAAEYVLGVLSAQERREVERRLAQEPAFASEVALWEERLGGFADAVTPVAPPANAWSRIEATIAAPARRLASLWQNLAFWRSF